MRETSTIRYRSTDTIGGLAAEEDSLLQSCFVDAGHVSLVKDPTDTRPLLVGRTGSGKTALLRALPISTERVIQLKPVNLSLDYLSQSQLLTFLLSIDVRLDPLLKLLWRHVTVVEVLKRHFPGEPKSTPALLERIVYLCRGAEQKKAIEYLREFGEEFWEPTEKRIEKFTTVMEDRLEAELGGSVSEFRASVASDSTKRAETIVELRQRAHQVISRLQLKRLEATLSTLNELVTDKQKRYYVTIDGLDENWVSEEIRFRLIRALIDSVSEFNDAVKNVKVIVALRNDLLLEVLDRTRDASTQLEKYESRIHTIHWAKADLVSMLDKRVNHVFKQRYTKQQLTVADILPSEVKGVVAIEYLLDRTLLRPRDAISFLNDIIVSADGAIEILAEHVLRAEHQYSLGRLRALCDEWRGSVPWLEDVYTILLRARKKGQFKLREIPRSQRDDVAQKISNLANNDAGVRLLRQAEQCISDGEVSDRFMVEVLAVLFESGLIGYKQPASDGVRYCYQVFKPLVQERPVKETTFVIHPMFRSALDLG